MRLFTREKRLDWPLPPAAPRSRAGRSQQKWFFRVTAAVVLFLVFLAIRETQVPLGVQVREGLQYVLTTEWNYQPVVDRVVRLGLQTVSVDLPFLDTVPQRPDGDTEMVTVPANGLLPPVPGTVVREFGWVADPVDNRERFHPGVDISAPAGTPVRAVMSGLVSQVGENPTYGPYVLIDHGSEVYTLYAQLQNIQVRKADRVEAGRVLAEVGNKGDFPGPGVHFEFREQGALVNPLEKITFP
ncbi:M23 family metallopeptidase [Candidatus Desulforudis audaxviator]|uniref:M23 family metallopeptidase n=1 Tax=Candidatus Desulforudis audaxviator TaxID=471827 RepID=UPI00107CA48D|nr:M23 family metallopeptidase [Candidatus Desulforudis audaxviator]AZK59979.1 Stage IV sporulation protein FA (SpoIVFA) [Candidatus Desulforudis audaxviator]